MKTLDYTGLGASPVKAVFQHDPRMKMESLGIAVLPAPTFVKRRA